MADEALRVDLARPRVEPWVMDTAFLGLLLLVFVGLTPFAIRNPGVLAPGASGVAGAGDAMRQICYLLVFAVILGGSILNRGMATLAAVPPVFAVLLAWCLASALWATEPNVAFRRAALEIVVALSFLLSVDALGTDRALKLLRWVLIGVLIVDWASIPLIHQSIHLPGEADPGLVGDWRGLYFHKNIAGAVSALSAMIFLFFAIETRRWSDVVLFIAAIGFTVMTRSKSSLGLLPVALVFGLTYRAAWRSGLDRMIVAVVSLIALLLALSVAILDADAITRTLSDPTEFTGRAAIWQAEIAFARDHALLGSGFGTFSDTGALSPLHNYVGGGWVETVAHGHNGYLQVLVTIGGIGFVLTMLGLVILPALTFWRQDGPNLSLRALLFTIFVFGLLHNFMETDFLESDAPAWVSFLLMLGMMRDTRTWNPAQAK